MGNVRNQCFTVLILSLSGIIAGISAGWTSPNLKLFQSKDTPLPCGPLTEHELSWVVSMMSISGFASTIFGGWLSDYKGRIWTIRFSAVPAILSWIFVYYAQNEYFLYLSRFLVGICNGLSLVTTPVFEAEIVENRIRGIVGTCDTMSNYVGVLLGFIVGHFFSFKTATLFFSIFPILFLILSFFIPESPFYLVTQNKLDQAEKSLAFFRNVKNSNKHKNENYIHELETLRTQHVLFNLENDIKTLHKSSRIPEFKHFVTPSAKKGLFLAFILVTLNQCSGNSAIQSYASTIFEESGSNFDPNVCAIVIGSIQLFGVATTTMMVDRMGRRFLIMVSTVGTALGLTIISCFAYIKSLGYDVGEYLWVPLTSISFVVYIVSWGAITLTYLIIAEILPEKIRSTGMAISVSMLWLQSAFIAQLFFMMSMLIGLHGIMLFFAFTCFLGAFFILKYLPETKGKSLVEIQEIFAK